MHQEYSLDINKTVTYDKDFRHFSNPRIYTENVFANLYPNSKKPFQWAVKRAFDIIGSFFGLIVLSPVFVLLIILIKLDSNGPAIFKQKRVGLNKKEFNMYKFRSMVCGAEKKHELLKKYNQTNPVMFKMQDDPRLTAIGKFIRKYSIDELPQLYNVLKGDMSLVGPRPPLVSEVEEYKSWHHVRFTTLPGLTGMWQVSGRSSIKDFDEVVGLDYRYISEWNFALDIKLILKTIPVVLFGMDAA